VQHLLNLVAPLLELCSEAGVLICGHYHAPGTTDFQAKDDQSPLTLADTESHAVLQAGLRALAPDIPVLSEESAPEALVGRLGWSEYWLVDPLDGTKEFLAETGEFTVNIALIREHRPVLGILYLPLVQIAYVGIPGHGAFSFEHHGAGEWTRQALVPAVLKQPGALRVLASRRHRNSKLEECLQWLRQHWGPITRHDSGSALKFCQLARGDGDFYPRFSPCCEWDTAAGQALVEAVGGAVLGMDGEPLRYNCSESLLSPHFFAVADAGHPLWRELLDEQRF